MFAKKKIKATTNTISSIEDYKAYLEKHYQTQDETKKKQLAQDLYLVTKSLLSRHAEILSPHEKGELFYLYVACWKKSKYEMSIEDTQYSTADDAPYYTEWPMTAGFNLSRAAFSSKGYSDLKFIAVNFNHCDFSEAHFPFERFEDCTMYHIKTSFHTNLAQSSFLKCKLHSLDLSKQSEVSLRHCTYANSSLKSNTSSIHCNESKSKKAKKATPALAPPQIIMSDDNLIEFFLANLSETSGFSDIRLVAKKPLNVEWLKRGMTKRNGFCHQSKILNT